MIPCMGGFCLSRGYCANYYAESKFEPVERLCGAVEEVEPMGDERRRVGGWQSNGAGQTYLLPNPGRGQPPSFLSDL